MLLTINGEPTHLPTSEEHIDIHELLRLLSIQPHLVAVARNQDIVRKELWSSTLVTAGDGLEIVHFVAGGSGL